MFSYANGNLDFLDKKLYRLKIGCSNKQILGKMVLVSFFVHLATLDCLYVFLIEQISISRYFYTKLFDAPVIKHSTEFISEK